MYTEAKLNEYLAHFTAKERQVLRESAAQYDHYLQQLPPATPTEGEAQPWGILALNGASGAGQSFVMAYVRQLLEQRGIELPRIYLLATREPRPGEGDRNPYIFVEEVEGGFRDRFHPDRFYRWDDIYYHYVSRPGAANAILMADALRARRERMYLETVIPTLLHIQREAIRGLPPWGDHLTILYLVVPTGAEWLYRLLQREPERVKEAAFRQKLIGRVRSSLKDMALAVEEQIPVIFNRWGEGEKAAEELLAAWGLG